MSPTVRRHALNHGSNRVGSDSASKSSLVPWRRCGRTLVLDVHPDRVEVDVAALHDARLRAGELARVAAKRGVTAAAMAALERA